ncbi:hypothetical protein BJ912DRAFT_90175 [Pholiota molesta]|nr:hypothetical protein BJ912DRAFT_90175 [Pholiota molesta]
MRGAALSCCPSVGILSVMLPATYWLRKQHPTKMSTRVQHLMVPVCVCRPRPCPRLCWPHPYLRGDDDDVVVVVVVVVCVWCVWVAWIRLCLTRVFDVSGWGGLVVRACGSCMVGDCRLDVAYWATT